MELVAPSKRLGGGEIDYQLEFGRLLHRDIAGFILLLHRRGQHLALSWLYLPCALKAAIGNGKRTLGNPRHSAAPTGAAARACGIARRAAHRTARAAGVTDTLNGAEAASRAAWEGSGSHTLVKRRPTPIPA